MKVYVVVYVEFSEEYFYSKVFDSEIKNCLTSADHPENKTGGPKFDQLNVNDAYEKCNIALKKHPT